MTAFIHVTLENGDLMFRPIKALDTLRDKAENLENVDLKAFEPYTLSTRSKALDLSLKLDMAKARAVSVKLLASDDSREYTTVTVYRSAFGQGETAFNRLYLTIDTTHSSLSPNPRGRIPETAEIPWIAGQPVDLRILVDKCMVEVFGNERQYLMQMMYPTLPESDKIEITALGGDVKAVSVDCYTMKPMNRDISNI
jgi:beta-fructofuranosidase